MGGGRVHSYVEALDEAECGAKLLPPAASECVKGQGNTQHGHDEIIGNGSAFGKGVGVDGQSAKAISIAVVPRMAKLCQAGACT